MLGEDQRNRYRTKPVQRGNTTTSLWLIPNRQPADAPHRCNPPAGPSRTGRRGMSPARLSARCCRPKPTLSPGPIVAADTSLPLLLNKASLEAGQPDPGEDTRRVSWVVRSYFGLCLGCWFHVGFHI